MLHPTVFNTSEVCFQLGASYAVLSPGSRNAPLIISFARNKKIQKFIIPDERSAGFVALGIAQETKAPVVLCCTSGTALLNYGPAIAEAYYRQIPLIVLSADRPPELIDQRDGQTIRQFKALKNHTKASIQLPVINNEYDAIEYEKKLIKGIQLCTSLPPGPIHINVPFREPFYPEENQALEFTPVKKPVRKQAEFDEIPDIEYKELKKILILIGQQDSDPLLTERLSLLAKHIPVLNSPLNNIQVGIKYSDAFVGDQAGLRPDLLITSGLSVLSKKLKTFLREQKPKLHLHFDPSYVKVDTYQTHPELVRSSLFHFLEKISTDHVDRDYLQRWIELSERSKKAMDLFVDQHIFSEVHIMKSILDAVPENSSLHLSNSMPVRYVDLFHTKHKVNVFSNRGTSGIDGCTSTALGSALASSKLHTLITGDLAFLYDRNAFFHNYLPKNLRVIISNNCGGGIFRLISGPSKLPELEEFFETRHNKTAEYICAENGLEYIPVRDNVTLDKELNTFWENADCCKVLEVFSDPSDNQKNYKNLRNNINEYVQD